MIEKQFILENIDTASFYGLRDENIDLIKSLFPKIKITARGNKIKVSGNEQEINLFEHDFMLLIEHIEKYNSIDKKTINKIVNKLGDVVNYDKKNTIIFGNTGKIIKPRNESQKKIVKYSNEADLLFAIGPAGTGKTYIAIALAVKALKNKTVKRIVLSRPAVEAGEELGFLPGDFKDKLDPYLQPLYDALFDMIPKAKLQEYFDDGIIEIAPLAFMRGRTLENSFVILDEAQNTTNMQLKMFLTRMGESSKFIVTGDITQTDLPKNKKSGLQNAIDILDNDDDIKFVFFNTDDVVRHKLVKKIIEAYDS